MGTLFIDKTGYDIHPIGGSHGVRSRSVTNVSDRHCARWSRREELYVLQAKCGSAGDKCSWHLLHPLQAGYAPDIRSWHYAGLPPRQREGAAVAR